MPNFFQVFTLEQVIGIGIAVLVIFAGLVSIAFVIWGGFLMIISGGNEEKVKKAVNHIRHAAIGAVMIVATLYIFPTFLDLFGLEYGDYMRPSAVFKSIEGLSDTIFGQDISTMPDTPGAPEITDDFSDL